MAGTLQDVLIAEISKQLGSLSPLAPLLLNFPGIKDKLFSDPLFKQVVNIPGLGPAGTMRSYSMGAQTNALYNAFANSGSGSLSPMDMQYRWAIEQFTGNQGMADAFMRNPVASMAMRIWDPLQMQPAGQVMAKSVMAAQQMYGALGRDYISGSVGYKRAMYGLYTGPGGLMGALQNSPGGFGDLSYKQVMEVASELISAGDPLKGVDLSNAGSVENAAKKFSNKVKELSKAIAPLKSLFGEDIPALFNALEQITGGTQLFRDPTKIQQIRTNLQATMDVTGASKDQYMGALSVFQSAMYTNKQDTRAVLGANIMAQRYLLGTANASFVGLTGREYQAAAAQFITGTARSRFADDYNAALAIYMQEGRGNRSEAAFRAQFDALAGRGVNNTDALLSILQSSGVQGISSPSDFARGRNYTQYLDYSRNGVGALASAQVGLRDIFATAYQNASGPIKQLLGSYMNDPVKMAQFIANRVDEGLQASNPAAAKVRSEAWNYLAGVGRSVFGFNTMDQWQGYGATMYQNAIMAPIVQSRASLISALDSIDVASGWQGILNTLQSKGGPGKTTLLDAVGGFFGVIDPAKATPAMRAALQKQLGNAFTDTAVADKFANTFRDALINSTTWSAARFSAFRNIISGTGGTAEDRYNEYMNFVDVESTLDKLRTFYKDDNEYNSASIDFLSRYAEEKEALKGLPEAKREQLLQNFKADFLAGEALGYSDNSEAAKLLRKAIQADTSGTGSGVFSKLQSLREKGNEDVYAQAEKLFEDKLKPLIGGPEWTEKIYNLIFDWFTSNKPKVNQEASKPAEPVRTEQAQPASA